MDPITPGNTLAKIDGAQQIQQQLNRDAVVSSHEGTKQEKAATEAKAKTVTQTEKTELDPIRAEEEKRREERRRKREERKKEEEKKRDEELLKSRHNLDLFA